MFGARPEVEDDSASHSKSQTDTKLVARQASPVKECTWKSKLRAVRPPIYISHPSSEVTLSCLCHLLHYQKQSDGIILDGLRLRLVIYTPKQENKNAYSVGMSIFVHWRTRTPQRSDSRFPPTLPAFSSKNLGDLVTP